MAIILPIVSNFNKKGITDATAALSELGDRLKGVAAQVGFAAFMSQSINQAKDLQRNTAALEGVFGSYADRMKQFTIDAKDFGLSQTEAARTSVFLGSVLKGAGFGMEEVAKRTKTLTVLAQDLAVTYGYSTSEALTAMTALFRGEYDPIEKFGVALKQQEVNALLAAKGLDHLTGQAMLNAQQQIRMEQLLLRSNDAQGAYARQSDTLFVAQQNLATAFKNLQANAAQPLTIALGKLFAGMVPIVENAGPGLTESFARFADIILTLTPLLNPIAALVGTLAGEFNLLIAALGTLIKPMIEPLIGLIQFLTGVLVSLFNWVHENAGAIVVWTTAILAITVAVKALTFAWTAFQAVTAIVGAVTVAIRTLSVAVAGYMSSVAGATMAQALFDIALGAINPYALVIGLAVIGTGIAVIANEAMNAKVSVDALNGALQTTSNTTIPKLDFSGGAPVGLSPGNVKNPMDGATTTWFSGGSWWTASYDAKSGKWSKPKEYVAPTNKDKGKQKVDELKKFYADLADAVKKQNATLKLQKLGASSELIQSIIGTGADWERVFKDVTKQGKSGIQKLQTEFNRTAAGQNALLEAFTEQQRLKHKKLVDQYEADQKVYEEQKRLYDAQVQAIANFKDAIAGITDTLLPLAVATRELGQYEQAAVDAFSNIASTIKDALKDGTLTKDAAAELNKYAAAEKDALVKIGEQRDEIANKRSLAKSVLQDVKDAIVGIGNITSLIEKQTNKVTVSITKMVGNLKVTTSRTVDEVTNSGGLVDSFKNILEKTRNFASQLKELRKLGLDQNLYKQIVDAGIDAGSTTAEEIIKGGAGTVTELNNLFTELNTTGASIAEETAQVMYGAGVNITDGIIAGLVSQEQLLVDQAKKMADAFITAFNEKMATLAVPNISVPIAPTNPGEFVAPTVEDIPLRKQEFTLAQLKDISLATVTSDAIWKENAKLAAKLIATPEYKRGNVITVNVSTAVGTNGKTVGKAIQAELNKYLKATSK